MRERCPVLKRIVVPDEVGPEFQDWDQRPENEARHRSILLLAMEDGHLGRVTAPLHRFLIEAGSPRPELRRQYAQDLRERWMQCEDPFERHQRSRTFQGRLFELHWAAWLESQGWSISGLEALREGPDIEAVVDGVTTAFELKLIGRSDEQFGLVLESLERGAAGRWGTSDDIPVNFLLLKVYEAAKQLQRSSRSRRVAVVLIDDLAWRRFELPLQEKWVNWRNPSFYEGDHQWQAFLKEQRERFPDIDDDLGPALRSLDALQIFRCSAGFEFTWEFNLEGHADS